MASDGSDDGKPRLAAGGEAARLSMLRRTALLDTDPDEVFDRYVHLCAALTDAPIALFSLLDEDRQWFKAKTGLGPRETPRSWAFCNGVIDTGEPLVVEDTLADRRFADNPLVYGPPHIRFYAGAPVVVNGQFILGALCVLDTMPREMPAGRLAALKHLAAMLSREIEAHHLGAQETAGAEAARRAAVEIRHQMRNNFSKVNALVAMTEREGLSAPELAATTRRRLIALARASELALEYEFGAIPAIRLFDTACADQQNMPALDGDAAAISLAAASVLCPLGEQLAYDARRRGVLSESGGALLTWRLNEDRFVLTWEEDAQEEGGAFASAYLTECAPMALRGEYRVENAAGRVRYMLDVPAASVLAAD